MPRGVSLIKVPYEEEPSTKCLNNQPPPAFLSLCLAEQDLQKWDSWADPGPYFLSPPWFLMSSEPLIIALQGCCGLFVGVSGEEDPQPSSQTHFNS